MNRSKKQRLDEREEYGVPPIPNRLSPTIISLKVPPEDTHFPAFSKPEIIDCFSLDSKRKYIDGPHHLKFLQLPSNIQNANFDLDKLNSKESLSHDGQAAAAKDVEEMHKETNELVHLLHWIHAQQETFMQRKPHFVFYRGLMTKILGTPYEGRDGWKIGAMLKDGTIYLRNIDTTESIEDRLRQHNDPRSRQMTSWGYNFEHFLLSESPSSLPTPHDSNIEKNECNFVFHTKLGSHILIYAAEIDGVWLPPDVTDMNPKVDKDLLKKCNLVELKTTRLFPRGEMTRNFRKFNLRKWFCQSYAVGISHVIAGLRNDDGVVQELRVFPVKELSDLRLEWSSNVCFKFLETFLTEVKKTVGGAEDFVFIFQFDPSISNRFSKSIRVEAEPIDTSPLYLPNIK